MLHPAKRPRFDEPLIAAGDDEAYFDLCSFQVATDDRTTALTGPQEDHIEALSAAAGPHGVEAFLDNWAAGTYVCARCAWPLYASAAKWRGPCAWPSFREPLAGTESVRARPVEGYNQYTCAVAEVYCGACGLFIGHQFEDAREKGDFGPGCTGWRH
mmetsp:Transcript_87907/g.246927  ORF Transcript_87907/g.246927 Transcript_87907/m.246927 type:complete len:157 (+) Transcript_87907:151-621(+)